jgi:hypothetical protein
MTASKFKATCRDWRSKYPDLSDEEIEQRIVGILKPPAIESGPDRASLIRNALRAELGVEDDWRRVVSPDGVVCYVTRLWGKEPEQALAA